MAQTTAEQAKRRTKKKPATKKAATVLVLRTCAADMISHGGFRWPTSGPVEAKDWNPEPVCGGGLHGLLWGEGDGRLLDWSSDAKWLVVEVADGTTVDLGRKVKFPRGVVAFCGERKAATDYLAARAPATVKAIVGGTSTSGVGGTSTSGYRGTSTSGVYGTSTSGDYGTSTSGDGGTSTSGDGGTSTSGVGGTSTSGYRGTSTSGYRGILQMRWWDGNRYRIATFYVGEDGIEPDAPYRCENGKAIKCEKHANGKAA